MAEFISDETQIVGVGDAVKFENKPMPQSLRQMCQYYSLSRDFYGDNKLEDVCHHPYNIPKEDSCGPCNLEHCPFFKSRRKEDENDKT